MSIAFTAGLTALTGCSFAIGCLAQTTQPTDQSVLPHSAPVEPEAALATFRVRPGFHLELVAAEPLLRDPIECCFDEDGRLYVVEMIDYSELREVQPHLGRVRCLEDLNGDGRFDKSSVYADDLPWPSGVICWDGGIFVAATPDILYLKDTNDDGKADVRQVVFSGFASDYAPYRTNQLNVQAMLNSFRWGLDNRIHGATGPNGGKVYSPLHPETPPLNLRGRDFAFDPRSLKLAAEAGGGQYGLSFDDRGRRFTCNNSDHIRVFMAEARYTTRNPWFSFPPSLASIAADGPAAEVFRTSPEEPWRVLRSQWRVAGRVPGPIEGGGRSSGYFTSATGITIYRGDAWPTGYLGDAFIADCGSNLIHHKRIDSDDVKLTARRPDDERGTEFVQGSDVWFRPVQFANAPDGTLYVIDMYREIIEHPWSLPPGIKEQLDLNRGNDRGRIYRILPDGFQPRPAPRLSSADTIEWVRTLSHRNAWHRETAARLLYARQDRATARPELENLLFHSDSPLGRLHALYALKGLSSLTIQHVAKALADPDDRVREHAVKLSERWLQEPGTSPDALRTALLGLVDDPSPHVRYQLAFTMGEFDHSDRIPALLKIVRHDPASPWIRAAVLSSLARGGSEMFQLVASRLAQSDAPADYPFLEELVEVLGARNAPADVDAILDLVHHAEPALAFTLVHALGQGLQRARAPLPAGQLEPVLARASTIANDRSAPETTRIQAIELLGLSKFSEFGIQLLDLLRIEEPQGVQSAALRTLGRFPESAVGSTLVSAWPTLTPRLRVEALHVLLARTDRVERLLEAIRAKAIRRSDLSSLQLDFLMNYGDARIRSEAVPAVGGRAIGVSRGEAGPIPSRLGTAR